MAKKCSNCGTVWNETDNYCHRCGSSEAVYDNSFNSEYVQQNYGDYYSQQYQQFQQPVYNPGTMNDQQQNPYNPFPQPVPKKKKTGKRIAIAFVSIVILCIASVIINVIFEKNGFGNSSIISDNSETSGYSYTKGTVGNGFYVNEWANIKFEITDEWPQLREEDFNGTFESTYNEEIGFCSLNELNGKAFLVSFINNSGLLRNYTADEYIKSFYDDLSKTYIDEGIILDTDEITDIVIADENFRVMNISLNGPASTVYQCICVRKLDNRFIVISVSATDKDTITERLNTIVKAR